MKEARNLFALLIIFVLSMVMATDAVAQEWYKVNRHYEGYGASWAFPYSAEQISHFDFISDKSGVRAFRADAADDAGRCIPFDVETIDSITFADQLGEDEQTHNKYQVYTLNVTTNDGVGVNSKEEYVECFVSLDGKDGYNLYSGPAQIRGRGNSTWLWYDKKPYRIKLDEKHKMLGLDKNRDWVLLANYRDVTDLMNNFMFTVARWMDMPYVNHTRYVELFLDGDYRGLYQLTEQVEQGKSRVDVADEGGILLAMDLDDGPSLSPNETDNFWSSVYQMPMCVKYPKDVDSQRKQEIRDELAKVERAIKRVDYDALDSLMDIRSLMVMSMLQEYCENVEICAPRSIYMYKDVDGKWAMGPFWDWDAGFDFNWGSTNTYFEDYRELVLGSDPANRIGMYGNTPRFFTDMFKSNRYTTEYKALWNSVKDEIFTRNWAEMEKYVAELSGNGTYDMSVSAYARDAKRWPIRGKMVKNEIEKMRKWLEKRTQYLTQVINAYPQTGNDEPQEEKEYGVISTATAENEIIINAMMEKQAGYSQPFRIDIDPFTVATMMGVSEDELMASEHLNLVPLNADGSEGSNTAAGAYGAWFSDAGNTTPYGTTGGGWWGGGQTVSSHVYIESNELFSWACGCHPELCQAGHQHTVHMQYRLRQGRETKAVTVTVNFGIDVKPASASQYPEGSYKGMTCVGSETITATYDMSKVAAYAKQDIKIDMDNILAKFPAGTTLFDLTFMACADLETGELTDQKTSSDGYYMMFDGLATAYLRSECKIGYSAWDSILRFAYTADIETPASGSRCTASVYLVLDNKFYYEFKMDITLN